MVDIVSNAWPFIVGTLSVLLALTVSAHVVLFKRDTRSAAGWVGVVLFFPIFGSILYVLFGINRIQRRAAEIRGVRLHLLTDTAEMRHALEPLHDILPPGSEHLEGLGYLVGRVTRVALTAGNRVEPLIDGDVAFPAMIAAIDAAEHTVALATYIFDRDRAGLRFADALERAVRRGVMVRVLVDAVGARYSWPPITQDLRRRGVRVERFLHSVFPWRMPFLNLRSHRKILVVDGNVGFTGGMNIREGNLRRETSRDPVQDVHFRFRGPVVAHLMQVFAEDWAFTTREVLKGVDWFPPIAAAGPVVARGIADGPDEDLDKLRWAMLGGLARAQRSVRIVTPYFLPDSTLIMSVNLAAMRGVDVEIVLPAHNNLRLVQWASTAELWQVLSHGCRVLLSPLPFDHSKLMIVDDLWVLLGSANWDPRSLRLNFEFNVECYDPALGRELGRIIDEKVAVARPVTKSEVDARRLPIKLRDGIARLAKPYL